MFFVKGYVSSANYKQELLAVLDNIFVWLNFPSDMSKQG